MGRGAGRYLAGVLLVAAAYVAAAEAAFAIAAFNPSISPMWLPSGLAVAAVLLFGYRLAPGVLLGAFTANAMTPAPLWVSGLIAVGNTIEPVVAAGLLRRLGFRVTIDRVRDVVALIGVAAVVAPAISATVAVGSLVAGGVVPPRDLRPSWLMLWSGYGIGVLSLAPVLVLAWSMRYERRMPSRGRLVEWGVLALALLPLSLGLAVGALRPFSVFPVLVWAAIRFRRAGACLVSLTCTTVIMYRTGHDVGTFVYGQIIKSPLSNLLLAQAFDAVVTATGLLVAAITIERERANEQLRLATRQIEQRNQEIELRNRELERERAQLDEAQSIARLGSWEWEAATRTQRWSDEMYRIYGLQPQSRALDYPGFLARVHPDDRDRVDAALRAMRVDGTPYSIEYRLYGVDGQHRILHGRGKATRDAGTGSTRLLGTVQDVTERKQFEQALAAACAEALDASRLKSQFLATMSHEIRTPLNAVIGLSALLRASPLEPRLRRYAHGIHSAGTALLAIIDDILDFSRIEAGRLQLDEVDFTLDSVVDDVITILAESAHAKGLSLDTSRRPGLPADAVRGDPVRLRQILLNLVSNAIKFTTEGGITVQVGPSGALPVPDGTVAICIEVVDTGLGIPADKQADLFEPFVQADASTTRRYGGTGLGLAISRRLAETMGGRLEVSSHPGRGSTFRCTVPLLRAREHPVEQGDSDSAEVRSADSTGRILLVEDNEINRMVALEVLTRLGYRADVAADGEQAVAMAEKTRYQAILMDCRMPVMDGYTATATIRATEGTARHTPIIAMTAGAFAEDRRRCLAAGMDDFVTKPFDIEQLAATLARWINRPSPAR